MKNAQFTAIKPKKFQDLKIGTFDTEQISLKDRTFRCSSVAFEFRGKNKVVYFTEFENMFQFMIKQKFDVIYCFNLVHDETYFYNYCYANGYEIQSIESGRSLGISVVKNNQILIKIKDFFPFVLCSLEKACYNYKCKTKKFKVDFDNCTDPEIKKHVENDSIMLLELIQRYRKTNVVDFCDKSIYSLASLSIKILRTKYITTPIINPFVYFDQNRYVLNERLYNFVKKTYKGGLCSAFDNEIHYDCVVLDMNSDYPFQTQNEKFPCGKMYWTYNLEEFLDLTQEICGFCRVKLYLSEYCICEVVNNKLCLVEGVQDVYLTSYELRYAIECNAQILEFCEGCYSLEYDKTFALARYMKDYFEKKKTAKSNEERETAKRLINAPTGKFGQKPDQEKICIKAFDSEIEAIQFLTEMGITANIRHTNDKVLIKYKELNESIKPFMFPSWISIITAKARIDLIKMQKLTHAYYTDTDSVHFERKYLEFVPKELLGSELGQWKTESVMEYERCLAPKLYASFYDRNYIVENKKAESELDLYNVKAKGVPSSIQKSLFYDIMNAEDEISYEFNQNLGYKASFTRKNNVVNKVGQFASIVHKKVVVCPKLKTIDEGFIPT